MTLEQIILSALSGAFGGAGAYGLYLGLATWIDIRERHKAAEQMRKALEDPQTRAYYEEVTREITNMAERLGGRVIVDDNGLPKTVKKGK